MWRCSCRRPNTMLAKINSHIAFLIRFASSLVSFMKIFGKTNKVLIAMRNIHLRLFMYVAKKHYLHILLDGDALNVFKRHPPQNISCTFKLKIFLLKDLKSVGKTLTALELRGLKNILIASTTPRVWMPLTFLRYSWVSSSYRSFLYAF